MPHVTTILGNEAGIQYQGVKDASSVLGVPLINGLIVGQFKRGRLDRPMTITLENIRGTLGHDPNNPDYIAVMDALSAGVPSVQVMRVKTSAGGGVIEVPMITCANATQYAVLKGLNILSGFDPQVTTDIYVNGALVADNIDATFLNQSWLNDSRLSSNASALGYTVTGTSSMDEVFNNQGLNNITFAFVPKNNGVYNGITYLAKDAIQIAGGNSNPTVFKDSETGIITFCLSGSLQNV